MITLTKNSGIAISYTVPDTYPSERINNKAVEARLLNEGMLYLDFDGLVNGFVGGCQLKEYRDNLDWQYVNYTEFFG